MNQICLICRQDVGSKFALAAGGHGVFLILRLMFSRLLRWRMKDIRRTMGSAKSSVDIYTYVEVILERRRAE
jgi:hypothetical protein